MSAPPGAKKLDYWWTVLATDPVAVPLVRVLARKRWLSPDQVTVVAFVLGLAAGASFALGTRASLVGGGLLFYAAFVVDCVDGKLARALAVSSPRGEALDHVADASRRFAASVGLTVWLWRSSSDPASVWWAIVYVTIAYYFIEMSGAPKEPSGSGARGRWAAALARHRLLPNPGMPDVQAVVFVLGPLTGLVVPALALGSAMVAVAILLTMKRRLTT